jgi:hypothetical protein
MLALRSISAVFLSDNCSHQDYRLGKVRNARFNKKIRTMNRYLKIPLSVIVVLVIIVVNPARAVVVA